MMIRFLELATIVLLGALVVTKVLIPLLTPKKRASERDVEQALRHRHDAENRLHAAIEDEQAHGMMDAASKLKPASGRGDLHRNMKWVEAHRAEYAGLWVALKDGELILMGPSRGALQEAIEDRDDLRDLLVVFVEEQEEQKKEEPTISGSGKA